MKSPEMVNVINSLSLLLFGRSNSECLAAKTCVACGGPATEFKDEVSQREYNISVLCQNCQNTLFNSTMD